MINRRGLIVGLGAGFLAAPAIVRASSIMPVRVPRLVVPAVGRYIRFVATFDGVGRIETSDDNISWRPLPQNAGPIRTSSTIMVVQHGVRR